jgi:hypothetical protein
VTDFVVPKVPKGNIAVQLSGDILVTFRNRVPGSDPVEYVAWPEDVTVQLVVGRGVSQVTADAEIIGDLAKCRIESTVADAIKDKTPWACRVSVADDTATNDIVAINGIIVRDDGS